MTRNSVVLILVGIILAGALIGYFRFRTEQYDAKTNISPSKKVTVLSVIKEYNDPVGFKFSYPESASVAAKKITKDTVYASLEITSPSTKGNISIEAVSSTLQKLDTLVATKTGVANIKLADLAAKQYTEKDKIMTFALDKGVLFTITVTPEGNSEYWSTVNKKIISTFVFALPETPSQQSSQTSESDITFEGEETVE